MATKKKDEMTQVSADVFRNAETGLQNAQQLQKNPVPVSGSGISADAVMDYGKNYNDLNAKSETYRQNADKLYNEYVNNRGSFSYDYNNDPIFQSLKKNYDKQAQKAAADASALAAARTGGYGNSYGATAASQAYNESIADLFANVPQLEENAYARYREDNNELLKGYDMANETAQDYYNRAYNERAYGDTRGDTDWQKNMTEREYEDSREDTMYNRDFAERQYRDSREDTAWQKDLTEREYNDSRADRAEDLKRQDAATAASYGDYSILNSMGIDTRKYESVEQHQRDLDAAISKAQYGDYSGLKAMGYDTSYAEQSLQQAEADARFEQDLQLAQLYATITGDASALIKLMKARGMNTSGLVSRDPTENKGSGGTGTKGSTKKKSSGSAGGSGGGGSSNKGEKNVKSDKSDKSEKKSAPKSDEVETAQKKYDQLNAADKYVVDLIANGYDPKWALSR